METNNKNQSLETMNSQELLNYTKSLLQENQELHKITKNKYGILFERKAEKVEEEMQLNYPILKEDISKKIFNGKDQTNNILIKGDNLHALTVLQYTHKEKVDVIYIDPPYNTGNKDFKYNDRFVDKEDVFRHSKWLSFMEKRLILAKELLKDSGVIFISIDDNEMAQLKLLCDGIFGENNFIQNFLWNKNSGGSSLSKYTRTDYEYILCYAKNISYIKSEFLGKYSEGMGDSSLINKPNKYKKLLFRERTIKFISLQEGIIKKFKNIDFELLQDIKIINGYNYNDVEIFAKWKWGQEKLEAEIESNTKIISKSENLRLRYIKDNKGGIIKPTKSITYENGVGYTVSGTSELQNIFGKVPFDFPKPTSLIKYLIRMVTYDNKNSVILDFFAGSGTTGQAVLELNKEDAGNRQFILCTNNEGNICTEVCYPRLQKIMQGYVNAKEEKVEGLGGNLSYFKTEFIDKDFDKLARETVLRDIANKCKDILKIKENVFEEIKSDESDFYSIIQGKNKIVGTYFNPDLNKEEGLKNILLKSEKKEKILYCFTYGSKLEEPIKKRWEEVGVEAVAIPKEIMDIYDNAINSIKKNTIPDEDLPFAISKEDEE